MCVCGGGGFSKLRQVQQEAAYNCRDIEMRWWSGVSLPVGDKSCWIYMRPLLKPTVSMAMWVAVLGSLDMACC